MPHTVSHKSSKAAEGAFTNRAFWFGPMVQRLLNVLFVIAVVGYFYARSHAGTLPFADEILPELFQDPVQVNTPPSSNPFHYMGTTYEITSVADYEIWGLVVSHNDIFEFGDIYHDETSVDVRDVCVIWGDNLKDNTFRNVQYWSEPWSCHFHAPDRETFLAFEKTQLSNTHLLSADPDVRNAVWDLKVGDQIYMRGQLINYHPEGNPRGMRKSSLIRTDTGNGACEAMKVEEFQVLKQGTPEWNARQGLMKSIVFGIVLLKVLSFLFVPYRHYTRAKD